MNVQFKQLADEELGVDQRNADVSISNFFFLILINEIVKMPWNNTFSAKIYFSCNSDTASYFS